MKTLFFSGPAALCFLLSARAQVDPPVITEHPKSQSVSLGAKVSLRAAASGQTPIAWQWQFNQQNIPGATNSILTLTNGALTDAGDYAAIAANASGSVTSRVASVDVDAAFVKITEGAIVNDVGGFTAGAWADYDQNATLDVFVSVLGGRPFFYEGDGQGRFARINTLSLVAPVVNSFASSWVDYDNDGRLDLFVLNEGQRHLLFHHEGGGTFVPVAAGPLTTDVGNSVSFAWGDYDRDGWVDLFIANRNGQRNALYHNDGDGRFSRITAGPVAADGGSEGCAWVDYDHDGYLDLFAVNIGQKSYLYHNEQGKGFTRITSGSIVNDSGGITCAWGDYDNDGLIDLFIANFGQDRLYHNEGNGSFRRMTNAPIAASGGNSVGCAWGDYNNDGYLDLFVANWQNENNFLYRNAGDGTFSRVLAGSPANDGGHSYGCAWIDFNGDGALDLFVANRGQKNFLYRNNLAASRWLRVRCVGTRSNRAGIGAQIRLRATMAGKTTWQLRQIFAGDGENNGHTLDAEFGLGDAAVVEQLHVEWPSGAVQVMHEVAVNQTLTLTEPPKIALASRATDGIYRFTVGGSKNRALEVEHSSDLRHWRSALTVTNPDALMEYADPELKAIPARFYRVLTR